MALSVRGAVLHVRNDAAGPETNGLSWATAFNSITQALQSASSGDELWVAAGTYKGAVQVSRGVALYGGFAGDETVRTERDWGRNRTVIDWDQWGDYPFEYLEFKSAVLLSADSRLDGFMVLNGWSSYGAGVYADDSGALIANNIIVTNRVTGILGSAVLVDSVGEFDASDDFFLRTANDLLRLQFPFGATNIPVTAYGPTVHRLLQVAANVYDAAHSNAFPSVFRPQFASTAEGPIISGYYQDDAASTVNTWLVDNPHGIPMIIGARKGFPNFNELSLQTAVLAARRLELRRLNTNSPPYQTNEMYIIGISNFVGIEAWNSYTQAFGHDVLLQVSTVCSYTLISGSDIVLSKQFTNASSSSAPFWPGFADPSNPERAANRLSFKVPIFTNNIVLPNSVYSFGPPYFVGTNAPFESGSGFRIPDWQLSISSRLIFLLSSGGRIVDFVLFDNLTNSINLTALFFRDQPFVNESPIAAGCWRTNRTGSSRYIPTDGIQKQIDISDGAQPLPPSDWAQLNFDIWPDRIAAINGFHQFVLGFPGNTNLIQTAPFSPARKFVFAALWEANDPLVHTILEHLKDVTNNLRGMLVRPFTGEMATNHTLGHINSRYSPWRGNPGRIVQPWDIDPRLKDPGVVGSDVVEFSSGTRVNVRWLDHIHRGTPWQTLYFDRDAASANDWARQSLDRLSHPTNDWKIIEYLRGQLHYEEPGAPTRVLNNTVVGNIDGGLFIATNANAVVMNNVIAFNSSGLVNEGSGAAELSRNCVFGNTTDNIGDISTDPQFVPGDFTVIATSPLIDAGSSAALAWIEHNVLGAGVDIGALEFGPDGIPAFTSTRTGSSEYEFELRGYPGQSYVIEASTNLMEWIPITTNTADMGSIVIGDALGTNYSQRFYRAKTGK